MATLAWICIYSTGSLFVLFNVYLIRRNGQKK